MDDNFNSDNNSNKSTKSHLASTISTTIMTDAVVMEMVEAVIDNNNNNNKYDNKNNVNSNSDVNLWNIKSENEFVQNDDENLVEKLQESTIEQQLTVNNNDNMDLNRLGKFLTLKVKMSN